MAATTGPSSSPTNAAATNAAAIYEAVESLRERLSAAYGTFEGSGDLLVLREELGYVRERADSIQLAVIATLTALENL